VFGGIADSALHSDPTAAADDCRWRDAMDMLRRFLGPIMLAAIITFALVGMPLIKARSESAVRIDPPARDVSAATGGLQTAVIAGGCFWGIQAVYQHTRGVTNAVSGYAGGTKETADYKSVSYGRSTHAEAVQITFDPSVISYGQILQIYFSIAHDPTQLNRQGPDEGLQYRSEIFPRNDEQRQVAAAYVAQLDAAKVYGRPIVTKIDNNNGTAFYPAEDYHQDYALRHPTQPYIAMYDAPKVENLKTMFPDMFRSQPVTVAQAGR
jgi:peptide-methionine (S)-S-oxide reductase